MCTHLVAPLLAALIPMAAATDRRPQLITRSGHGRRSWSPLGSSVCNGIGHKSGGRKVHQPVGFMVFTTGSRPIASAKPSPGLSMPARPSVTTQHLSPLIPIIACL